MQSDAEIHRRLGGRPSFQKRYFEAVAITDKAGGFTHDQPKSLCLTLRPYLSTTDGDRDINTYFTKTRIDVAERLGFDDCRQI
jgi:hypothetical protein